MHRRAFLISLVSVASCGNLSAVLIRAVPATNLEEFLEQISQLNEIYDVTAVSKSIVDLGIGITIEGTVSEEAHSNLTDDQFARLRTFTNDCGAANNERQNSNQHTDFSIRNKHRTLLPLKKVGDMSKR